MPQALSSVYLHGVFSTAEHCSACGGKREASPSYLGGISKRLDCPPQIVGGVEDHVHILARFGRKISQAEWIKELKRASNVWIKKQDTSFSNFSWQGGYGVFAVEASRLPQVREYIIRQEEHHRQTTFQDELRALLREHGVEWDERYLWD